MKRFFEDIPIALKVSGLLTIAVVAMLLLLQNSASRHFQDTLTNLSQDRLRAIAVARAATIEASILQKMAELERIADGADIVNAIRLLSMAKAGTTPPHGADVALSNRVEAELTAVRRTLKGVAESLGARIVVTDQTGRRLFPTEPEGDMTETMASKPNSDDPWAKAAAQILRGKGFSTDALVIPREINDRTTFHFSVAVHDTAGQLTGVMIAEVPVSDIGPVRTIEPATETRVALAPRTVVAFDTPSDHAAPDSGGARNLVLRHIYPFEVKGARMAVEVRQPSAFLRAPVHVLRRAILIDGLVALFLVIAGGLVLAASISRPLVDLGRTIDNVANGIYNGAVGHMRRRDEVGQISRQIDRMRAALADAEAVARDNSFRSAALERASAALILADRNLTILHVNSAFDRLVESHRTTLARSLPEFGEKSLVGKNAVIMNRSAPQAARKIIEGDVTQICSDIRVGRLRFLFEQGPVRDHTGEIIGFVIEVKDVTQAYFDALRLRAFDASCAVAEFLPNRRLHNANSLFAGLFSRDPSDLVGESAERLLHWTGIDPWQKGDGGFAPLKRPILTGSARLNEGDAWHEAVACRECDAGGRLLSVTLVLPGAGVASAARHLMDDALALGEVRPE